MKPQHRMKIRKYLTHSALILSGCALSFLDELKKESSQKAADVLDENKFTLYFRLLTGFDMNDDQTKLVKQLFIERRKTGRINLEGLRQVGMTTLVVVACIYFQHVKLKKVMVFFPHTGLASARIFRAKWSEMTYKANLNLDLPVIIGHTETQLRGMNFDYAFVSDDGNRLESDKKDLISSNCVIANAKPIFFGTNENNKV